MKSRRILGRIPPPLAFHRVALPVHLRCRLRSANMIEWVNPAERDRTRVVGLFPNEQSLLRVVTAVFAEMSEEWESGKKVPASEARMSPAIRRLQKTSCTTRKYGMLTCTSERRVKCALRGRACGAGSRWAVQTPDESPKGVSYYSSHPVRFRDYNANNSGVLRSQNFCIFDSDRVRICRNSGKQRTCEYAGWDQTVPPERL